MQNEQTNETDTAGNQVSGALAPDGKPLTEYDKALELVKRREKATQEEKEVLDRKEKLAANAMLGGTTGGHVEAKQVSPDDLITKGAKEFFKGTKLEEDIGKL